MTRQRREQVDLQRSVLQAALLVAGFLACVVTFSSKTTVESSVKPELTQPPSCQVIETSAGSEIQALQRKWPVLSSAQYGGLILFCTCIATWVILRIQGFRASSVDLPDGGAPPAKIGLVDFSKPSSVLRLAQETAAASGIFLFVFVCEYFPPFPSTKRTWNVDDFSFYVLIFLAVSISSIKKVRDTSVLNRLQTDEWKGWMQWLFIMYHYCAASPTYNFIRVFICSYVWMTGYGNFIYFTTTNNFCLARFIHMMWRLNFAVTMLMTVMNKGWMVYYICPLHTFYFVLTFAVCFIYKQGNPTEWVLRAKVLATFASICIIWDGFGGQIFNLAWGVALSSEEGMGGTRGGTLWEWYFRTSLDKYACAFGMLIGLNRTRVSNILGGRSEHRPAYILTLAAACAYLVWWCLNHGTEVKAEYNKTNAYLAPGVVIAFVALRNSTELFRQYYLAFPACLGRVSLESYLLQYHVWLACGATKLLVVVPGLPKVNLLVTSAVFIFLANQLFERTMALRELLFADHGTDCLIVLCKMLLALLSFYCLGFVVVELNGGWLAVLFCSALLALVAVTLARVVASRYQLLPHTEEYDAEEDKIEPMEVAIAGADSNTESTTSTHKDAARQRRLRVWTGGAAVVTAFVWAGTYQIQLLRRDQQERVPVYRVPEGQYSNLLLGAGTSVVAAVLMGMLSQVRSG